jgi:hypothetical protein
MGRRFYYYTGPVEADFMGRNTAEDQQVAKDVLRKMHDYLNHLRENLLEETPLMRRLEVELGRRSDVGRAAVARVLRCSVAELDHIDRKAFDDLPDILVISGA